MSDLRYVMRVKAEIPVVKLGYEYVTRLITGLKESSAIMEWSLNKTASSVDHVVKYPLSYIENHLMTIDQVLCTSLDLTKLNLPILTKTPQQVFEESKEYVMGIITPITDWANMELLPPAEYYIDCFLPELDLNHKINQLNDKKDLKVCKLLIKLVHRVKQHAYAEPKYLGSLIHNGYKELILIIKIFVFEPKLLSKTFHEIWKKLSDGVTPEDARESVLLVEMGCMQFRRFISLTVNVIEITEEIAKYYIEMFMNYVNDRKHYVVDHFLCSVVNSETKKQQQNQDIHILLTKQ